jgi:hypothetical protein
LIRSGGRCWQLVAVCASPARLDKPPVGDARAMWQTDRMEKAVAPQDDIKPRRIRSLLGRLSPGLAIVSWLVLATFRSGLRISGLVWLAAGLCLSVAFWLIESRSRRPARTFYLLALFSIILALFCVAVPLANHSGIVTGVIGWAGITLLATIWAIHFERTEPRS